MKFISFLNVVIILKALGNLPSNIWKEGAQGDGGGSGIG